jgi:molybdate transport system substrate-binding protein
MRKLDSMKKTMFTLLIFLITLSACSNEKNGNNSIELTISAASSMEKALTELQSIYENEHKNVKLFFNFGSSGALQQQIVQGAPVDLFFSASSDKFNVLLEKGLIDKTYSIDLVGNELVLIQQKESNRNISGLADLSQPNLKRISIGTPESVPAGKYAKETLENINMWDTLEKKLILAKDVRQVLTYVETGNVDAGIVYKTDALFSQKVKIIEKVKQEHHSPIIYPLGIVKESTQKEEAIKFFDFLGSKTAKDVFEDNGFIFLEE